MPSLPEFLQLTAAGVVGFIIGILLKYFVPRFSLFNSKSFATLIGTIFSGSAFTFFAQNPMNLVFGYSFGVIAGVYFGDKFFPGFRSTVAVPTPEIGPLKESNLSIARSVDSPIEIPSGPAFKVLEIKKLLEFKSRKDGTHATVKRTQKIRANRSSSEFNLGHINADGVIDGIKVQCLSVNNAQQSVHKMAGRYFIKVHFHTPIPAGREIELILTYILRGSFPQENESLGHDVEHATDNLILEVLFHEKRPCQSCSLYLSYRGDGQELEGLAMRSENGDVLKAQIQNLVIGQQYHLYWKW